MMNRGGRGWEPPIVDYDERAQRRALHEIAMGPMRQPNELLAELRRRQAAVGIIDMVQHNGVWVTPEDAARGA
jgi:hypothetical protein